MISFGKIGKSSEEPKKKFTNFYLKNFSMSLTNNTLTYRWPNTKTRVYKITIFKKKKKTRLV